MKSKNLAGSVMLLITAFVWGAAFVAQSAGMDYVGPFTFNGVRCLIGGLVLLPVIALFSKKNRRQAERENRPEPTAAEKKKARRMLVIGGICCGAALFVASSLQQFGVKYTTVGKAGFITAMYIIIVPLMGLFLRKRVSLNVWISVIIAVIGMYLLCVTEKVTLSTGDLLVLLCAVVFSIHILIIDYFAPKVDGVKLSCIQFFTCSALSLIAMFIFEKPVIGDILSGWLPILYAGVMSCGVAYTLQILGQRNMDPTVASLILSLESVFAVIAGFVILGQSMSAREIIGCAIMFAAIILAQLPPIRRKQLKE